MTDANLQDLRRRVAAGDRDAAPALLRARVRAGELSQDRLELAALCGHEDARTAFGWRCLDSRHRPAPCAIFPTLLACTACAPDNDLKAFSDRLVRHGKPVVVRAAWLAASEVSTALRHADAFACEALDTVHTWLIDPTEAHMVAAARATNNDLRDPDDDDGLAWWQYPGVWCFLDPAAIDPEWSGLLVTGFQRAADAIGRLDERESLVERDGREGARRPYLERLMREVRAGLVAWALGDARG